MSLPGSAELVAQYSFCCVQNMLVCLVVEPWNSEYSQTKDF